MEAVCGDSEARHYHGKVVGWGVGSCSGILNNQNVTLGHKSHFNHSVRR